MDSDHLDFQCQLDDYNGRITVYSNLLSKHKKVHSVAKGKVATPADMKSLQDALEEVVAITQVPSLFKVTEAKLKLDKLQQAGATQQFLEALTAVVYDSHLGMPPEEFAEDTSYDILTQR